MALRATYQNDVLTSIGIEVYIKSGTGTGDGTMIDGAYSFGDLGADANELDATPLAATHSIKKPGLIDEPKWELNYYYNDTDFQTINTAKSATGTKTVTVKFPNGTKFTNTVEVASNYVTGSSVNGMIAAKASFTLGNANGWTRSTT